MRAFALLFAISAALVLVAACENVPDAHPAAPTATNTTGYAYPPPQGYAPPPYGSYPPTVPPFAAFVAGARVLVQWADGNRYPGIVHQVAQAHCFVVFPDGQQRWIELQYLTLVR